MIKSHNLQRDNENRASDRFWSGWGSIKTEQGVQGRAEDRWESSGAMMDGLMDGVWQFMFIDEYFFSA